MALDKRASAILKKEMLGRLLNPFPIIPKGTINKEEDSSCNSLRLSLF
jgi:hypothetical protein